MTERWIRGMVFGFFLILCSFYFSWVMDDSVMACITATGAVVIMSLVPTGKDKP